ncbi:MAG: TPM domain-containing protein [Puia sp.]|nr:TPM domain-containing protein [Puia sp.]
MKKILSILLTISCFFTYGQQIPPKPNPPRLVNDFAGVMTADQVSALERKLVNYDDSTSVQVAVVTMATIGDDAIEDVALKIQRDWGVGNKKTNNGVVILVAVKERKVWIATGYGMEGVLPDVTVKSIIDNEITPNFRGSDQDNYYRGFDLGADAIIKAAAGEYKAPEGYRQRGKGGGGGNLIGLGIIVLIILFLVIGRGGGGGGGGLFSGSGILPFILGSMLGGAGRGGWSGGGGGGGGWSDGGGGGGFGGFGGGSGGGGGAGGSW